MKLAFIFTIIFLIPKIYAGQIRNVNTNSEVMKDVHLKMGQSTVLRLDEKPKKIVIGNQNYYSVEFIENDITIQPLGIFKTNLFVYTNNHVYGFILNPKENGNYDDVLHVNWVEKELQKQIQSYSIKNISHKISFDNFDIKIKNIIINSSRESHIIEFEIRNNSLETLSIKDLRIFLTRTNQKLKNQDFALKSKRIGPLDSTLGRIFIRLDIKSDFQFNAEFKGDKKSQQISRRYL